MGNVSLPGDATDGLPDDAGRLSAPTVTAETLDPAAVVASVIERLDSQGVANNRGIGPAATAAAAAVLSTLRPAVTP